MMKLNLNNRQVLPSTMKHLITGILIPLFLSEIANDR